MSDHPTSKRMFKAILGSKKQKVEPEVNQQPNKNEPLILNQQSLSKTSLLSDHDQTQRSILTRSEINDQPFTQLSSSPATELPSYSNPVTELPSYSVTHLNTSQDIKKISEKVLSLPINLERSYRTPNWVDDELMPTLTLAEQSVFRRLYRLSYGFNRQITDSVSIPTIAKKCNLSDAGVKLALKSLEAKNLIIIHRDLSGNPLGGNRYEVLTKLLSNPVTELPSYSVTQLTTSSIKDHDDDPLKRQNHHQSTLPNINDHKKRVMMIYQEITGNLWSKADHSNYEKIKNIPIDKIEVAIRLAYDRATNRPNSFAFFIKEIIASVSPKAQSRTTRKKAMQKIVERVRNASVGSNISPSDFVYKVKEACLREDVAFDNDLLDELMSK